MNRFRSDTSKCAFSSIPQSCLRPKPLHSSSAIVGSHDILSSNLSLKSLCHSNRINEARVLFDQMPLRDDYSWNTIITAYVRYGRLSEALRLFNISPHSNSDTISWSFLIAAHTRHGRVPEALDLFRRMLIEGPKPDRYTLGSALRACSSQSYLLAGQQIHALAVKSLLGDQAFVIAGLVDMYAKCRCLGDAACLFQAVPPSDRNNHVLWAAMVTGHAQNGDAVTALRLFKSMLSEGVGPNHFVLPSVLGACATELASNLGSQVHGFVVRTGFEGNDFVQCSLVDMYAKCDDPISAREVLEQMDTDDVVAWNSLLVGCARSGRMDKALSLFVDMHRRGLEMDGFTYPSVLSCMASSGLAENGRSVHGLIIKTGLDEGHQHVANALLDMYAKCGRLDYACGVFDRMRHRDVVAWTSLITGCARNVSFDKALSLFREMRAEGVDSDEFLAAAVLSSCAGHAVLGLGRQVHTITVRRGFDSFVTVGNALVTLYSKCGCVDEARRVFESMAERDAITWTALIVGYAQNGRGRDSLRIYDLMTRSGARPDYVTFIGLLFACSHAGLVEDGRVHFESMEKVHGIVPRPEHYASMIDLFGRSGRIREAVELLDSMATPPDATVWKALLAACRVHRHVGLAERVAENLFELEPGDAMPYVLLSNVYSAARRWGDMARVRALMRSRGINKEPGCSWMEVGQEVHVFRAEDTAHERAAEIYAKVEEMMHRIKKAGYLPDAEWALHEAGDEGWEKSLAHHSEKFAVAFGLMSLPQEAPIRIFKNLRICGDCHNAMKFASKVFERTIVLRDANCFHHFGGGACSCRDYW